MKYNYDYFISYAHADNVSEDGVSGFVDVFVEKLKNSTEHQQMFGGKIKVFFDKSEIHSMSDWDNKIRSSLASSRFLIVLMSPGYFKSEYCAREFDWWMQHEMHRRVLGEGTAPMLIVSVNDLYNFNVDPIPEIPQDIQVKFPNWVKQIRQIQAGPDFDLHNLERTKIDEILRSLCEKTKDKVFKQ
ncbi:MAG: toll/interleukin-1 receptor domain-containing protein, partial [Thermoguttaceae bacterium]|nr:toll/interleukin-1 receptor domain-containing protein [Thermoguttaceae bacterium]